MRPVLFRIVWMRVSYINETVHLTLNLTTRLSGDLQDLVVDLQGLDYLYETTGINGNGQIVGYGRIGINFKGFLLTPVPEPRTIVLLALGEVVIARKRRDC